MHCHTTNRKLKEILTESATVDFISSKMKEHEIEKTVLLATYFPHRGSGISNFRLYNWIRDRPEFTMFASLDFENYFYQGLNEIEELAEMKVIKGVKIYTCYQNVDLKSENFNILVNLAKKYTLPMMFHCGFSYSSMRKTGRPVITENVKPRDLEFIAKANPEMNLILSHMAKPFFHDLIRVISENENIYTDMSGLIDSKYDRDEIEINAREIRKFLEECGSGKLLFGTDFPIQLHEDSVSFIETAMEKFPDKDKENVYYNNARRILYGAK